MPADSALQDTDLAGEYILLAVMGERPQVLTELIWSLAQEGAYPKRVIVLTTARGERTLRAQLLGDRSHRNIKYLEDRWTDFCDQVLGSNPFDPGGDIEVPDRDGTKIEDIYAPRDGRLFENWCFDLVHSLTRDMDAPPLYGCVAGGRKTMAQDLTTAFTLYARGGDRLFHVIVSEHIEEDVPTFFWPRADRDHDEYADEVHRVDKSFPHLRARLEEGLLSEIGDDLDERSHYQELLDALDPRALTKPKQVTLRIRKKTTAKGNEKRKESGSVLLMKDARGEPMGEVRLTVENVATLLILWSTLWEEGEQEKVVHSDFIMPWVDDTRQRIYEAFGRDKDKDKDNFTPWCHEESNKEIYDYADHIYRLNEKLRAKSAFERYLQAQKIPSNSLSNDYEEEATVRHFPHPLPENIHLQIEIVPDEDEKLLQLVNERVWNRLDLPRPEIVDN